MKIGAQPFSPSSLGAQGQHPLWVASGDPAQQSSAGDQPQSGKIPIAAHAARGPQPLPPFLWATFSHSHCVAAWPWTLPALRCGQKWKGPGGNSSTPRRRAQTRMQILQCHNSTKPLYCYQTSGFPTNQVQVEGRTGRGRAGGGGGEAGASHIQISVSFLVLWYWGQCVLTSHLPCDSQAPARSEVAHSLREPSPDAGSALPLCPVSAVGTVRGQEQAALWAGGEAESGDYPQ